jgi:hypothetical protein
MNCQSISNLEQAAQIAANLPNRLDFEIDTWAVTTCSHGIQEVSSG